MVILMGQQGGTCWKLFIGIKPRIFRWCEKCLESVIRRKEDLFQGCPARPHHPRVWGFLLPTDRTPSVIKSLHRLRGTVDTVSAHHQITGAACQRGTAELA